MAKTTYCKAYCTLLTQSWKPYKRIGLTALVDLIFYAAVFGMLFKALSFLQVISFSLSGLDWTAVQTGNVEQLEMNVLIMKNFMNKLYLSIAVFALSLTTVYAVTNAVIWHVITRKSFDKQYIKHFVMLCFPWALAWLVGIMLLLFSQKPDSFIVWIPVTAFLFVHLSTIAFSRFSDTHKKWKSVKEAFHMGILNIHHFILPYLTFVVVFFAVLMALSFFGPPSWLIGIGALLVVSWARMYIYHVVQYVAGRRPYQKVHKKTASVVKKKKR